MKLDALAIGAHADDVELGCGGTVALLASHGRKVGVLHLTRGEAGTRGTVEERQHEAEVAARALERQRSSFSTLAMAPCARGQAEEDALIGVLRRLQPELVLGPAPSDRHPDHGRAHRLVADACYYSGLARRGEGEPHRPGAVFSYMPTRPLCPQLCRRCHRHLGPQAGGPGRL